MGYEVSVTKDRGKQILSFLFLFRTIMSTVSESYWNFFFKKKKKKETLPDMDFGHVLPVPVSTQVLGQKCCVRAT